MAIVVGYVPTEEGRAAVRLAAEEAVVRRARLIVVASQRIDDSRTQPALHEFEQKVEKARSDLARDVTKGIAEVRALLDKEGVPHEVRAMVPSDDPSSDLTRVAEEENATFIVIGMRRRTAVGKFLLGSHAQRIILDAPCPVIAVHASAPAGA